MLLRRDRGIVSSLRLAFAGVAVGCLLLSAATAQPMSGSFLPPDFFDSVPFTGEGQAAVEADLLSYDAANDVIVAQGGVVMTYEGYVLRTERLVFNRRTGELKTEGGVTVANPNGNRFTTRDLEVTGGFKRAYMRSLTLRTYDGSLITADSADFSRELQVILENGTYSPCGECIDSKGRRIGWKVRGTRIVYDRNGASVVVDQPVVEMLGVPVIWLPWMRFPDPSQPRGNGFRLPEFDFTPQMGVTVEYPYFYAIDNDTDLLLIPRLMTRQGALMTVDLTHRFANGVVNARAAGTYALDRSAFAGTVGDRDWRGAIQVSGSFVPVKEWTVGWSYTAFTDAAFLPDYKLATGKNSVNEVYATHLSTDNFADLRVQQFNLLGNVTPLQQDQHARAIPNIRASNVTDLPNDWGQWRTNLRVLGVQRGADHVATINGVPYIHAYKENKAHATVETSWQKQFVAPGGVLVTPYLGFRADAAYYDGSSPLLPGTVSLLSTTPIAALDVRWPVVADDGLSSYLFEPIAQLVYRGSSTTGPGITNDNALSFAFDDSNLFSYDRFSGTDRQETGLRANVGAHYLANFSDGSWLDLVGGQSYFLGGVNSLATPDAAQVGASTGLGMPASHFVVGARAGFNNEFTATGKLRFDPSAAKVAMGTMGASYANAQRYSAALAYTYIAADAGIGQIADQHEITGSAGVPIDDYWTATATASWDLATNTWLEAGGGLLYDDGYLDFSVGGLVTGPTHSTPNDIRVSAGIHVKGPAGKYGFSR